MTSPLPAAACPSAEREDCHCCKGSVRAARPPECSCSRSPCGGLAPASRRGWCSPRPLGGLLARPPPISLSGLAEPCTLVHPRLQGCARVCVSSPSLHFHSFFSGSQRALGVHGSGMHGQRCRVWFRARSVHHPGAPSVSAGGGGPEPPTPSVAALQSLLWICGVATLPASSCFLTFSLRNLFYSRTPPPHSVISWRVLGGCCLRWSVCWDKP